MIAGLLARRRTGGGTRRVADGPVRRIAREFVKSRAAAVALVVFAILVAMALLAEIVAPQNPYDLAQLDILNARLRPLSHDADGVVYLLGTDDLGRDLLSAILYGLRTSLAVGFASTGAALVVGIVLGLAAGYFGGTADTVIMRLVDLQLSFPAVLIALMLLAVMGSGLDKVVFALIAVQWAYFARTVRGSALVERRKEYIEAARSLALPDWRIVLGHLLPNTIPPVIVVAAMNMAHAISLEATLSFLGVGAPVTEPSLGRLIANGYAYMLSGEYWISIFPGIVLLATIVAVNMIGDRLRDTLNPRRKR